MYADVTITESNGDSIVVIKPQVKLFFKIILFLFFIPIASLPFLAFVLIFKMEFSLNIWTFMLIGVSIVIVLFIYKHFKRAFGKEILTINANKISYKKSFLGIGTYWEVEKSRVLALKFYGYFEMPKHELEIKGDVYGFGTQQAEINYLNDEGTVLLETEHAIFKFGVDVDEEDFIRIKSLI